MFKLISLIVTLFAIVNCQEPPNGIIWAEHQQPQHQHHIHHFEAQAREAALGEEEEQVLGFPLMGLKMAPLMFGLPGTRIANFNLGKIGGLHYGSHLLGAGNPFANDQEPQQPQQHYHAAHYHQAEAQLGAPQHYHGYQEAEAHLGAPQQYQGAEYNQYQGAEYNQYQEANLGAPGDQPQAPAPFAPIANLFQPIVQPGSLFGPTTPKPQAPEQRTWDKKG